MSNHRILVIGGTSGIGREVALSHFKQGHDVTITGRNLARTISIAAEIGENVQAISLDLAKPGEIATQLASVQDIDYLVLVAIERDHNSAKDYNFERAMRLVTVKLIGYTEVIHTILPRMRDSGSIVIFGGLAKERPYPGSTTVTMVNGGVTSMIKTLAIELTPVRVNAVHPGIIADSPAWMSQADVIKRVKERTPGGRLAMTEDIVSSVDFLLTNKGINGVNLTVDGGWMLM
jgi:NAD(P)-dependent dehydrogenase (short-subunit alcohol dehydrogenase family)